MNADTPPSSPYVPPSARSFATTLPLLPESHELAPIAIALPTARATGVPPLVLVPFLVVLISSLAVAGRLRISRALGGAASPCQVSPNVHRLDPLSCE